MFAVRPICRQDAIFKMISVSPDVHLEEMSYTCNRFVLALIFSHFQVIDSDDFEYVLSLVMCIPAYITHKNKTFSMVLDMSYWNFL